MNENNPDFEQPSVPEPPEVERNSTAQCDRPLPPNPVQITTIQASRLVPPDSPPTENSCRLGYIQEGGSSEKFLDCTHAVLRSIQEHNYKHMPSKKLVFQLRNNVVVGIASQDRASGLLGFTKVDDAESTLNKVGAVQQPIIVQVDAAGNISARTVPPGVSDSLVHDVLSHLRDLNDIHQLKADHMLGDRYLVMEIRKRSSETLIYVNPMR